MIEIAHSSSKFDHYTRSLESFEPFEPFDSNFHQFEEEGFKQEEHPFGLKDSPLPFSDVMEGGHDGNSDAEIPQSWSHTYESWSEIPSQSSQLQSQIPASSSHTEPIQQGGNVPRRYTIQNPPASSSMPSTLSGYGYTEAPKPSMVGYQHSVAIPTSQPQYQASTSSSSSASQGCFCALLGQQCHCPKPRPRFYTMGASPSPSGTSNTRPLPGPSESPQDRKRLHLAPDSTLSSWSTSNRDESLAQPMYHSAEHSRFHSPAFSQPSHLHSASPLVYPTGLATQQSPTSYQDLSYLYDSIGMTTPSTPSTTTATHLGTSTALTSNSDAEMSMKTESPEMATMQLYRPYSHHLTMSHLHPESKLQPSDLQHYSSFSAVARPGYPRHHKSGQSSALPNWANQSDISASIYSPSHSSSELYSSMSAPIKRSHTRSDTNVSMSASSSSASRHNTADDYDLSNSALMASPTASNLNRFTTDDERWNAIVNRSHAADSHFVYGALTTRIYCRPSCASKRPDRNRVVLFDFPDAPSKAEYAGFRACKRCKPGMPGTADACVLAVGQCLRHITQAALLGESDEVDTRLKKRTLKEYSSDYGVSAFHFHRTLKNVCTLTPGDYSKACHALVLQDEIGMDKREDGRPLDADELQLKLRGWSTRRARRAVGNVLPSTYAQGFPGMKMFCIYTPDTSFGNIAVLYSKGADSVADHVAHPLDTDAYSNVHCTVYTVLIGDNALARLQKRAPNAVQVADQSDWLRVLVEDLARKGSREVQMPTEVIPWVRRARVWLAVKLAMEPKTRSVGSGKKKSSNTDEGDDEEEEDEEEFDLDETSLGAIAASN